MANDDKGKVDRMPDTAPGGQPKARQIADDLLYAIQSGEYQPGARIMGENQIQAQYGVSKITAREALKLLTDWGKVETRHGSGTFVRDFRPVVRNGIRRLSSETWPAGRSIWTADTEGRDTREDVTVYQEDNPGRRVRDALELPDGASALVRFRTHFVDGKPVLLSMSSLITDMVTGSAITQRDTGPGGTYARLRDLGHAPAHFREDIRSRMPLPDEIDRLHIAPGTPVFQLERIAYDADWRPVEINEMTADASAYVFRYDFSVRDMQ